MQLDFHFESTSEITSRTLTVTMQTTWPAIKMTDLLNNGSIR